jgi:hypothetical protein
VLPQSTTHLIVPRLSYATIRTQSWLRKAAQSPQLVEKIGRHERTRTADPYRVKVVLYQLSYVPKGKTRSRIVYCLNLTGFAASRRLPPS